MKKFLKSLGHGKVETTIIYKERVWATDHHAIHEWEAANFESSI